MGLINDDGEISSIVNFSSSVEALLKGELNRIGDILNLGWEYKQQMADDIVNDEIQSIYDRALASGASGGKISGAGGGGFMLFYCPNNTRHKVEKLLTGVVGKIQPFEFTKSGMRSWKAD